MEVVNVFLIVLTIVIPIIFISLAVLFAFKRNIYQSLAKIGMTVFAIGLSVLITKLVAPTIARPTFIQLVGTAGEISSGLTDGIARILATLIMPIIFTGIFSLVSLICLILYLTISKRKLTDAKIAEMKKRKAAASTQPTQAKTPITDNVEQENTTQIANDNTKNKKIWLRVGCVALSVLSVILVLAHFAMPLSYYSDVAEDTLSVSVVREAGGDEFLPVIKLVSNYPTVQCYRFMSAPATWCFDRITTPGGEGDSARNTISTFITVVDSLTNLENTPKREDFYAVAILLNENPYLDNLLLQTADNLVDAWSKEESLFGLDAGVLGNSFSLDTVKFCLKNVDSAAELFYMLGDLISLPEIIDDGVTPEALTEVFVKFQTQSITVLERFVLDGVKDLDKFSIDVSEDLVSSVFSVILDIKTDDTMPDAEKTAALTTEAESLNVFLSLMENPKIADPETVGMAIAQSKAISDAIISATDGGNEKDPCGFGKALTSSFVNKVKAAIEKDGISKDSELYKATNTFFSKK